MFMLKVAKPSQGAKFFDSMISNFSQIILNLTLIIGVPVSISNPNHFNNVADIMSDLMYTSSIHIL